MKEEFPLVFAGHCAEPQKRVSNVEELIANAGDEWFHKASIKKVPRLILLFRERLANLDISKMVDEENTHLQTLSEQMMTEILALLNDEDFEVTPNSKTTLAVFDSFNTCACLGGMYSQIFGHDNICRAFTSAVLFNKLNYSTLFDSLIKFIMGINQLFFNRANINFGNAIVKVNGSHRTTPAYSAWAFNQLYGAAVMENSGLAKPAFKLEEPNVFLQENAEGNLEPIQYNSLMYAL